MLIDRTHRKWAFASAVMLGVATLGYLPYALAIAGGARGNTLPGLIYGALGYLMMLFAGLMGARRRVPLWRIGRASAWMRGHLWMGALSLPMILFHSAFSARGPLTFVLMTLLVVVVASGLTGAWLQHRTPRRITEVVRLETIYEQIPHVREQLRAQADRIVAGLCAEPGALPPADAGRVALAEDASEPLLDSADRSRLRDVYTHDVLPFLRDPETSGTVLASRMKSGPFFDALRLRLPETIHTSLATLEDLCEEQRQLTEQKRMYVWMHAWLLVHVPLSITLLVLGFLHAAMAIRY